MFLLNAEHAPPAQSTIIDVLEGENLVDIAVCAAVADNDGVPAGNILGQAVMHARNNKAEQVKGDAPGWQAVVPRARKAEGEGALPELAALVGEEARRRVEVRCWGGQGG